MENLFENEEKILENALAYLEEIPEGFCCSREKFKEVTREYARLLKTVKSITKLSDRTVEDLNSTRLDLLAQVSIDALTGIYNRKYLEDNLNTTIEELGKTKGCLSVIMLDVDYFKRYNDIYGHQKGDECLQLVSKAFVQGIAKKNDFVARYGGEEFAVILPNANEERGRTVAQKILDNVRNCRIQHEKNEAAPYVTVSAGVATGKVTATRSGEEFLKKADEALYYSKQTGRNKYTFAAFEEVE